MLSKNYMDKQQRGVECFVNKHDTKKVSRKSEH